jgi:hypothetical protein
VPAIALLIACNPTVQFAGLANELDNRVGGGVSLASTSSGTGGSLGTGGGGVTIDAGPAQSLCDCAEAIVQASSTCVTCNTANCTSAFTACEQATPASACSEGESCVFGCDGGPCIAGCLGMFPSYATYLECLYSACAPSCGWSPALDCPYDAGTD